MNKYKRLVNIKHAGSALIAATFMFASCTGDYMNLNTNQYEVTDDMLNHDNLGIGGFILQMEQDVVPVSDVGANAYQRAQNLSGDTFCGYMAAIGTWGSANNVNYYLHYSDWNDVCFSNGFTTVMAGWKQVRDKAETENPTSYALAQVLKVAGMHRVADSYGPIPYKDFGKLLSPYNSLEDVYTMFFEELNGAIDVLKEFVDKTPEARPMKKYDLVYEGDYTKWLKFANSLKLRLAMRIAYVKPDLAEQYAKEAIAGGVITDNTDNAALHSSNGIVISHPLKVIWNGMTDTRMGASIESYLLGYNDDRATKYFSLSSLGDGKSLHGVRNGIILGNKGNYVKASCPNIQETTPVMWMSAAEVYFLRAEAALRWKTESNPKDLYEQGIKTSFAQWGATVGEYLADDTSIPASYSDAITGNNNVAFGPSTITVKWEESDGFEKKLERIITQKWLAIYPDGQEAWSEMRRTGYPKIFELVNVSGSSSLKRNEIPYRIPFPKTEYETNKAEVEKGVALLGAGAIDEGNIKLWWDKK